MNNLLYALLLIAIGWVVGATSFGAVVFMRLRRFVTGRRRKMYTNMAIAKGLYASTSIVLLHALISQGSADASPQAWLYAGLSMLAGYFFSAVALTGVDELSQLEAEEWANQTEPGRHRNESSDARFSSLEGRVTAEESRNTDIEELARQHKAGTEEHPSEIHGIEEEERKD